MAAIAAPRVEWYLCDLYSGTWLARVPFACESFLDNFGQINTVDGVLNLAQKGCPPEVPGYLTPGFNRMMVLCLNDNPVQGWWVNGDVEWGGPQVPVNMSSLEACYDAANIPEFYGVYDDAYAAAQLCITDVGADGLATGLGGMGTRFGFVHEYANTGATSDHDYAASEVKTIYAALKAMADDGRIEFRCGVRWKTDKSGFQKYTQIRYRVGDYRTNSAFTSKARPDGTFAGTIKSYKRKISGGATAVIGSANPGGSVATVNPPVIATDLIALGFPVVEDREQFDGLDTVNDLTGAIRQRALTALAGKRGGVITYSFVLNPGTLLPGQDFDPGDTVPYRIDARPPLGEKRPSLDPFGGAGDARLLGYSMSLKDFTVTPNIWQPVSS